MGRSPGRDEPPRPPAGLTAADPREWMQVWARVRTTPAVKLVGAMAAHFADYGDGTDIRPGTVILAAVCGEMNEKTVRTALIQMRDWGLIWRYSEGRMQGRKGLSDVYRLTIPDDLMERAELLPPDYKLPEHRASRPVKPVDNPVAGPVDNPGTPGLTPGDDAQNTGPETREHRASDPGTPGLRPGHPYQVPKPLTQATSIAPAADGPVEGTTAALAVDNPETGHSDDAAPASRPAGLTDAQWADISWLYDAQRKILEEGNHRP